MPSLRALREVEAADPEVRAPTPLRVATLLEEVSEIGKAIGLLMVTLGWSLGGGYTWTIFGFMFLVGFGEGNWGCIGPLLNEVFPTSVRAAALGIIYNVSRGVQFLAPVIIAYVAARSTFGAGIALAAPFALLAGIAVWALPETKGVRLVEKARAIA